MNFSSWFQKYQFLGSWLHICQREVRQNLLTEMVEQCYSIHSGCEVKNKTKTVAVKYMTPKRNSRDLLLLVRPYLQTYPSSPNNTIKLRIHELKT